MHSDSVFSVAVVPREPFNVFVSGDCNDKCYVWKIVKADVGTPLAEPTDTTTDEVEGEETKSTDIPVVQ